MNFEIKDYIIGKLDNNELTEVIYSLVIYYRDNTIINDDKFSSAYTNSNTSDDVILYAKPKKIKAPSEDEEKLIYHKYFRGYVFLIIQDKK